MYQEFEGYPLKPVEKRVYNYEQNETLWDLDGYYWKNGEWVEGWKEFYTFDENGDYSGYTSYSYWTGEQVMDERILKEFNEQGAIKIYHYYSNKGEKGEVETQRLTATFLEDGLTISEYLCEDYWMHEVLEPYIKYVYEYDENGNRKVMNNYMWNDSLSAWEEPIVYTWNYDNEIEAENVLGHDYIWNRYGSVSLSSALEKSVPVYNRWNNYSYTNEYGDTKWEAFYINWNSIPENEVVLENLNVRGLEGMIRYEGETAANIGVFDMAGRLVATRENVVNCDITLNAGAYVVRVGDKAAKVVVREKVKVKREKGAKRVLVVCALFPFTFFLSPYSTIIFLVKIFPFSSILIR